MKTTSAGLAFVAAFTAIYALSVYWVMQGSWQSIFLIWLATFPFSLGLHELAGPLQDALQLSHQSRALLEAVLLGIFGVFEYYALGVLIATIVNKRRASSGHRDGEISSSRKHPLV